ncbi:polysaccharide deacetylase family protein [Succinispira mobilis]|uniref:polysaccharide deacetylase family protein n=1 Tax=Succinispira mobilis TaxID=78120 RepID=UPI0003660BA3|nr:polysaccharide deacetylase family protein [Succinispira mobilis]
MLRAIYKKIKKTRNIIFNIIDTPDIVLLYHRVNNLNSDIHQLAVTPEKFYLQMKFLKDNYTIVNFEDVGKIRNKRCVAITFDDGYMDNYLNALPILEELKIPATIFISTDMIANRQIFWWDKLESIIMGSEIYGECIEIEVEDLVFRKKICDRNDLIVIHNKIHPVLKKLEKNRREVYLSNLQKLFKTSEIEVDALGMTKEQLISLSKSKYITIGAHTITHTALSSQNYKTQMQEISGSKSYLEEVLSKEIKVFSYPFGGNNDYNKDTIRILTDLGFTNVASNFRGQVHRWTDCKQIPRYVVRDWDLQKFREAMNGFWVR